MTTISNRCLLKTIHVDHSFPEVVDLFWCKPSRRELAEQHGPETEEKGKDTWPERPW